MCDFNNNSKPSVDGVKKTGLETKRRPQPSVSQPEERISTQNKKVTTPSSRAYA